MQQERRGEASRGGRAQPREGRKPDRRTLLEPGGQRAARLRTARAEGAAHAAREDGRADRRGRTGHADPLHVHMRRRGPAPYVHRTPHARRPGADQPSGELHLLHHNVERRQGSRHGALPRGIAPLGARPTLSGVGRRAFRAAGAALRQGRQQGAEHPGQERRRPAHRLGLLPPRHGGRRRHLGKPRDQRGAAPRLCGRDTGTRCRKGRKRAGHDGLHPQVGHDERGPRKMAHRLRRHLLDPVLRREPASLLERCGRPHDRGRVPRRPRRVRRTDRTLLRLRPRTDDPGHGGRRPEAGSMPNCAPWPTGSRSPRTSW